MKKRELVQLIREAIFEGVMDNLTTQLSRVVVNHIKRNANSEEGISDFRGQVNDLMVNARFQMDASGAPIKTRGGSYNQLSRTLNVNISIPYDFTEQQLNAFIPQLKHTIRHELEHYRQDQRSGFVDPASGTHWSEPANADHPGYDSTKQDPYETIDNAYNYFLSPHEIEAWVMGMYKQAKTQKVPLIQIMQAKSAELQKHLQYKGKISNDDAESFAETLLLAWQDYAEKRLPGVKKSLGVI